MRSFAFVRRLVSPAQARRVADLRLDGVGFLKEGRRFYPNKEMAAQLLGFVGLDNRGLAGIEAAYDSQIRGAQGRLLVQVDARRHAFSRLERPPTAGASVELTIDEHFQHVAERELHDGVLRNKAAGGTPSSWIRRPAKFWRWRTSRPSIRTRRGVGDPAAQPCCAGHLRARLDVQGITASAALQERIVGIDAPIDAAA